MWLFVFEWQQDLTEKRSFGIEWQRDLTKWSLGVEWQQHRVVAR